MLNIFPFLFFGVCIFIFCIVADGVRKGWSDKEMFPYTAGIIIACIIYVMLGHFNFGVWI